MTWHVRYSLAIASSCSTVKRPSWRSRNPSLSIRSTRTPIAGSLRRCTSASGGRSVFTSDMISSSRVSWSSVIASNVARKCSPKRSLASKPAMRSRTGSVSAATDAPRAASSSRKISHDSSKRSAVSTDETRHIRSRQNATSRGVPRVASAIAAAACLEITLGAPGWRVSAAASAAMRKMSTRVRGTSSTEFSISACRGACDKAAKARDHPEAFPACRTSVPRTLFASRGSSSASSCRITMPLPPELRT